MESYTVLDLVQNDSFCRWSEGTADRHEKMLWDQWIEKNEENHRLAMQAQQVLVGFEYKPAGNSDADKVWNRIDEQISVDVGIHSSSKNSRDRQRSDFRMFLRIAAILAIVCSASLMFYMASDQQEQEPVFLSQNEIATGYGEQRHVTIADGSEIILNANSTLQYSVKDDYSVQVSLDGEAHFDVATRDSLIEGAFRVQTADGAVSVLGTRFVVSSRNDFTRVVLEEGKVLIEPFHHENSGIILQPDEMAEFDSSQNPVRTRKVNPDLYSSWTTPQLVFEQTPIHEVIERIQHTFGVEVAVRDSNLNNVTISGSVDNAGLDVILAVLSEILDAPIETEGDIVYIGEKTDK